MGKKANPTVIGLFVVGAVALAVLGVVVFGSGQLFKHTERFVMFFPGSVNGLNIGAPVKFKGVDIGQVTDIRLVLHRDQDVDQKLTIPVYVETDPSKVSVDGTRLQMHDPENLRLLIEHGLRGQLQAQSLVTGLLFVQIDFFPDTAVTYILPQPSDPMEIPTIPTALEQASSVAREIISELRNIKFGPMVQDASEALENLNKLLNSPALQHTVDALPDTVNSADQTFASVRNTVGTANTIIAPGSPLDHDLRTALRDVSEAARALGQLADYLERNPTALLYGKQPPPGGQP